MGCNVSPSVDTCASASPWRIAIPATTVSDSVATNAWMALSRYSVCRSIRCRCLDAVVRERSPVLSPAQKLSGRQAVRASSQAGSRMYRLQDGPATEPNSLRARMSLDGTHPQSQGVGGRSFVRSRSQPRFRSPSTPGSENRWLRL